LDINRKDHLVFAGCDLVELAETYGTPLHVVDELRLRQNYQAFLGAFQNSYSRVKVFYSYKTNCIPGVLALLHKEGCGAEVTSPYELWLASRLGVEPAAVVYNGVNKSEDDVLRAVELGIGLINIDSVSEVRKVSQAARRFQTRVNVGVRLDPGVGWKAQFGIQPRSEIIRDVVNEISGSDLLRLRCLHAHVGSGLRKTALHGRTIQALIRWLAELRNEFQVEIEAVDLGGGFGVPTVKPLTVRETAFYKLLNRPPREPSLEACPSIEEFGTTLTTLLKQCCARYDVPQPELLLEPGRIITSNAQILLLKVRDVKNRTSGARFALTDGGMQNIAFPLSYEYHHCLLVNRASAARNKRYFVTGPLCSPQDLLYRNWKLPELQRNDVIAIMDSGAYFTSFSNNFSYPRPAVVLGSNGVHKIIRARERFDQMIAADQI
jgi:diaminopimelate decarboxylase